MVLADGHARPTGSLRLCPVAPGEAAAKPLWLVCTTKAYSGVRADIAMESITASERPERSWHEASVAQGGSA